MIDDVHHLKLNTLDSNLDITYYPKTDMTLLMIGAFIAKVSSRDQIKLAHVASIEEADPDIYFIQTPGMVVYLGFTQIAKISRFLNIPIRRRYY